jgi:hypothetical protein
VAHSISVKPRRAKGKMQGFLDDAMVFEAEITGMPI